MLADHTKRNSLVYSHVLSLITDPNLKKMIQSTPGMQFDGYKALQCLRDHCFRELNNLTAQQLDSTWIAFTLNDVGINANSFNGTIDLQAAIAYLQLPRPPPARGAASRPRNGIRRGAGRGTTPTRAAPTRAAPRTSAAHFANEPDDHDDAEPITEESAHLTWVGDCFEILGPDDAAFSGSGYAFACSDSFDSAAAYLPTLDNLELDTAFVKPLERTVTPATTNGHIGYLAAAASLAAAAAVATAAAGLDAY